MQESPNGHQQDRDFVAAFLADRHAHETAMLDRLRIVPRLLAIRNARFGRPLDEHTLADLVSEVTMVILRKLDQYRGDGSLQAFCASFCDFELRNKVRAQRRRRAHFEALDEAHDPEAPMPDESSDEQARRALDRLGGVEAETIRLHLFDGLDWEAIAARMGTTAVNAKSRFYRGLRRLRELLGRRGDAA